VTDRYSAQRRIADSEQRYRLLAENSSDVVYLTDIDRRITWVSPSITQSTGWKPEDLVGRLQSGLIHPEDHQRVSEAFSSSSEQPYTAEFRFRRSNGAYAWFSATGRWATDDAGAVVGLVVGLRDIEARVQAEQELADREEHYRLLSENASDVVLQIGADGRIRWASESITSVLGWPGHAVLGRVATELVHPDDRDSAIAGLLDIEIGAGVNGRVRVLREDGSHQWMAVTVHRVQVEDRTFRIIALRDIQEAVHAQVELEHAIGHDPLTGLATRSATLVRLRHLLDRLPSSEHSVAVLCVGIDGLKTVNEALTHEAGDHVVAVLAGRISGCVAEEDLIGRGTGDEFLVLVPDLVSGADASLVAEQVRLAANGVLAIGAHRLEPTVSIGVASGTRISDPEDLLRDASLAMHQAKANGRDRAEFVDPQLASEAQRRLLVDGAVRDALRDGGLVPWFQPIVRLADSSVVGYEALVRWVRPDGSVVEPVAFLPVAERSSLITDIDIAILERSIAALGPLAAPMFVAVNVSAATLAQPDYAGRVLDLLAAYKVTPSRLHLEITETAVLRVTASVRSSMDRLADVGVRWFMDDFGTGYSSITHLRDLPISGLKLDRSFTQGVGAEEGTAEQLARALGGLAQGLGLDTVAEGIETEDEAAVLASHGWVHGQGWLYGKAEPLA
jgi:diguanylate cyclase (GGDEF)-like protein/PAS domain S-box-containing protein